MRYREGSDGEGEVRQRAFGLGDEHMKRVQSERFNLERQRGTGTTDLLTTHLTVDIGLASRLCLKDHVLGWLTTIGTPTLYSSVSTQISHSAMLSSRLMVPTPRQRASSSTLSTMLDLPKTLILRSSNL